MSRDYRNFFCAPTVHNTPLQDQESKLQPITIMPKYIKEASILGLVGGEGCTVVPQRAMVCHISVPLVFV